MLADTGGGAEEEGGGGRGRGAGSSENGGVTSRISVRHSSPVRSKVTIHLNTDSGAAADK